MRYSTAFLRSFMYYCLLMIAILTAADFFVSGKIAEMLIAKGPITLIGGLLGLRYRENTGVAFSILREHPQFLTVMIMAVLCVFIFLFIKYYGELTLLIKIAAVMVLTGGISNLVDRFVYGYVIDYFELLFMDYPIFNIADCLISVGAVVLIIGVILYDRHTEKRSDG